MNAIYICDIKQYITEKKLRQVSARLDGIMSCFHTTYYPHQISLSIKKGVVFLKTMTTFWKPGSAKPAQQGIVVKQETQVKLESGKKVKMLSTSTSSARGNASSSGAVLSKAVLGMKFMQRQAQIQALAKEESNIAKSTSENNSDSWFRNDHFVSEFAQNRDENLSDQNSKVLRVVLGNNTIKEVKIVSMRNEADIYSRLPGRRSFNGCNPAMERYYQQIVKDKYLEKQHQQEVKELEKEVANGQLITDEEMAERYEDSIRGNHSGNKQGKRSMTNNTKVREIRRKKV
jgi:hypothetical protein